MNAAARALAQNYWSLENVTSVVLSKKTLLMLLIIFIVLINAFSVIYVKDQNRRLHSQQQQLKIERDTVLSEWNRLVIEKSTWDTQNRIYTIASEELNMVVPQETTVIRD